MPQNGQDMFRRDVTTWWWLLFLLIRLGLSVNLLLVAKSNIFTRPSPILEKHLFREYCTCSSSLLALEQIIRYNTSTMMAKQTKLLYLIGFWAAIVAFVGAVGYIVSAFLQVFNVVGPLQDSFIGYGTSLLIPVPFLLTMLVLHYIIPAEKKFWTHTAIAFAIIYTTYNTLNYVVQLASVLPAGYTWTFENQQGTVGPLSLLNQTPHSLFWDMDGLGYIFLSLSTLFAFPVFENHGLQNWLRWFFIANALIIPLFAIVYFYPGYSVPQLFLGLPWGITVPGSMLLLALFFRSKYA